MKSIIIIFLMAYSYNHYNKNTTNTLKTQYQDFSKIEASGDYSTENIENKLNTLSTLNPQVKLKKEFLAFNNQRTNLLKISGFYEEGEDMDIREVLKEVKNILDINNISF